VRGPKKAAEGVRVSLRVCNFDARKVRVEISPQELSTMPISSKCSAQSPWKTSIHSKAWLVCG
jgi:hypothetical protein